MKIMIVDDVALMLRSLELMLSRNGFEVVKADCGVQALEHLAADFTIDLVITDLIMKPMDGVELFRQARIIERFNDSGTVPPPPFILMTSCEKTNSRDQVCQLGVRFARHEFAAIIEKPLSENELIPLLHSIQNKEEVASS